MSRTSRRIFFILAIVILLFIILLLFRCRIAHKDFTPAIANVQQNAFVYLDPTKQNQLLIAPAIQKKYAELYLQHYFSPWSQNFLIYYISILGPIHNMDEIKKLQLKDIEQFEKNPGYGINRLKNSATWVRDIVANMNMSTFPNQHRKVITLFGANLRLVPTNDFSFGEPTEAGEGYPFDYLQESFIAPNVPAIVLQTTKDGAWDLIFIHNDIGWMQSQNLADVDDKFIQEWQTGNYAVPVKDHVPVYNSNNQFHFFLNIGSLQPLVSTQVINNAPLPNAYQMLIAVADADQHAVIKLTQVNSQAMTLWPMFPTPINFALIINHMLGTYYGWGGMNNYRDCSATTGDLFATFGIWLPRNSADQALVGHFIPLENLRAEEKKKIIKTQGVPFLTLLKLPGHIVVYIGEKDGKAYIFHDFWGVHTKNLFGEEGRALVGKTAITPITLGAGYINVPKSFIDLIQGMTIFGLDFNMPVVKPSEPSRSRPPVVP